jgi:CrcB protein
VSDGTSLVGPRPGLCTSAMLVAGGGAIGAAARVGIELAVEQFGGSPIVWLLIVNLLGSFILGIVFARLDPRATDVLDLELPIEDLPGARRHHPIAGAFIATGICGALTTYSSLAAILVDLAHAGETVRAASMVLASLVAGPVAIGLGIVLGRPPRR